MPEQMLLEVAPVCLRVAFGVALLPLTITLLALDAIGHACWRKCTLMTLFLISSSVGRNFLLRSIRSLR